MLGELEVGEEDLLADLGGGVARWSCQSSKSMSFGLLVEDSFGSNC